MYKFIYLVPKDYLEVTKQAVFSAIASPYDKYDCCCYQTEVTGQFRPLDNSNSFIGDKNEVTYVKEYKVEMLVPDCKQVERVIEVLRQAHPYESPAYEAFKLDYYGF